MPHVAASLKSPHIRLCAVSGLCCVRVGRAPGGVSSFQGRFQRPLRQRTAHRLAAPRLQVVAAAEADDGPPCTHSSSGGGSGSLSSLWEHAGSAAESLAAYFPLWVLGAVAWAVAQPSAFAWFHPAYGSGQSALSATYLAVGLTLSSEDFKRVLASPGRIFDGLALQYAVMPTLALLISRCFGLPWYYTVGLCLVGCCPGGSASGVVSHLAGADVPLSVVATTAGALGAMVATPLLAKLLLGAMVPFDALALINSTLQVVLLPVLAGMAIREVFPQSTALLRPLCTLCTAALMALMCGSYVAHSGAAVLYAWPRLLAAVCVLHSGGFLLGYALSRALGLPEPAARSNCIQAGMRNSALAAQLAWLHFPAFPLATVPCTLSACMHTVLGSLLAVAWRARPAAATAAAATPLHQHQQPQQQDRQQFDEASSPNPSALAALLASALVPLAATAGAAAARTHALLHGLLASRQRRQQQQRGLLLEPPLADLDEPGMPAQRRPVNPYAMNIIIVGGECAPWSKTGGLGDVLQALPKALAQRGHRVMVVSPRYKQYEDAWETGVRVRLNVFGADQEVGFFHTYTDGVDHVFVDHPSYHEWGDEIYGGSSREVTFRCALLSKAALECPFHVPCGGYPYGDSNLLFIANDWHTALLPVYLQAHYRDYGKLQYARSLLVLHNMAHQGRGPMADLALLQIPEEYAPLFSQVDANGEHMNIMKAGALAAHRVVAVSNRYAEECQTPEFGCGLDGVLRKQAWKLKGVVNGIDEREWNPVIDTYLQADGYANYSMVTLEAGKARCKAALQRELGLPVNPHAPLLGFIGRLDYQKGVDLIADNYEWLMAEGVQLVLLGSGQQDLEQALREMQRRNPDKCRSWVGFSVALAHRITAGADMLLMPSRFEPCGLNQLYAMAYGTAPIVHAVGGLHDTVKPFDPYENSGVGWTFQGAEPESFRRAMNDALVTYRQYPQSFQGVQLRGMNQDLSWDNAAAQYEAVCLAAKYQW